MDQRDQLFEQNHYLETLLHFLQFFLQLFDFETLKEKKNERGIKHLTHRCVNSK